MTKTEVDKATEDILSQPAFQKYIPTKNPLEGLFDDMPDQGPLDIGPVGTYIVLGILGVIVAGLLIYLFYIVFKEYDLRGLIKKGSDGESIYRTTEGKARTKRDALAIARQAVSAKNFYQAIWILHRLLLGVLDENKVVRFEKWKTNTDYLQACPEADPMFGLLTDTTSIYNNVVYAHETTTSAEIEPLLHKIEGHLRA